MARESGRVMRIRNYLNSTYPRSKFIKMYGSVFTEGGTPDLMGCIDGRMVVIEVKNDEGKLRRLQRRRLDQWHRVRAVAFSARNIDDVKRILPLYFDFE